MRSKIVLPLVTALGATPALAVPPSLSISLANVTGAPVTRDETVGPTGVSVTNRDGTMAASADYGALSLNLQPRLVSLSDFGGGGTADGLVRMRDTLRLRGPARMVRMTFDYTPTLSATANGFGMTTASVRSIFQFYLANPFGPNLAWTVTHNMEDRPRIAPIGSFTSDLFGAIPAALERIAGTGAAAMP